jgi:hypothetical protein
MFAVKYKRSLSMIRFIIPALVIFVLLTNDAHAYVGPGLGLGVIGAFIGVVIAVILSIVGVIWYPLKRLFRKMKRTNPDAMDSTKDIKAGE